MHLLLEIMLYYLILRPLLYLQALTHAVLCINTYVYIINGFLGTCKLPELNMPVDGF